MNDKDFWAKYQASQKRPAGQPYGIEWGGWEIVDTVSSFCREYITGKIVTEIGCGGGKWTKALFDRMGAKEVHAFDVHQVSVEQTRQYEPRAVTTLQQGNDYPQSVLKSDIIFTYDVLLHLPQPLTFKYILNAVQMNIPIIFQFPIIESNDGKKLMFEQVRQEKYRSPYRSGYIEIYSTKFISDFCEAAGAKVKPISLIGNRDLLVYAYPK